MRFSVAILAPAVALHAGITAADGYAIIDALTNLQSKTSDLKNTVEFWSGDVFDAIPIVEDSNDVLDAILNGRDVARASDDLNAIEAITLSSYVTDLAGVVQETMKAFIDAQDKFEHLWVGSFVLDKLEEQKDASDEMSQAILEKTPKALQATAQALTAPIDAAFDSAISAFSN